MKAFLAKVWNAIKSAFSKAWAWSIGHKAIAIAVAATVVVGATCAIVLPIALHNHKFAEAWCSDAESHWHSATCKHEEEISDLAAHVYANDCDDTCDTCGYTRTVGAHVYDHACDTTCNVCEATRAITHNHATTLTVGETTHWYACTICGDKKDEANHTFDQTVAHSDYRKADASATTKAQYWKSCVCGAASTTEYFETDKTTGTLANIQDLSKDYNKVELANPTYETNSDGVVTIEWYQGETLLSEKPVNAGTYKVKVNIAESATYTGISEEKEFTITPKVLTNISLGNATYKGSTNFSFALSAYHGLVSGETFTLQVTTASKNVGNAVEITSISYNNNNYSIDKSAITLNIVPKVLNNVTYYFTYNGGNGYKQIYLTSADHGGIIGEDEVMLEVVFKTENETEYVGAAVDVAEFEEGNYVLGTYDFKIVPYDIDISSLRYRKVYDALDDTIHVAIPGVEGETISLHVEMSSADVDSHAVSAYFDGTANTANYTFSGKTAEAFKEHAKNNAQITPKALQITDVVTKNYDGNNTFTVVFTEETGTLDGNVVTVTFKLEDNATQNAVINIGPHSDATIRDAVSNDGNYVLVTRTCDAYVLDTNPLVLEVIDRFHIENDYILVSNIRQGSVKVGDSIVLPGSPDKVYEVLKIERLNKEQGQATLGEEVGIYIDGMADLSEVARGDLLYTQGNIPTLATTFFANIYAYKSDEGGRNTPFFNNYKPKIVGLGALQEATIEIVDVYGKDDGMVEPGDRALVKITLTNAVPASLLENLNFTMMESSKTTITGTVVDYVESHNYDNYGNSMVATDNFDAVAGMPTVIKLTNTRDETLDTLQFYYETVPGSGNYIINFTIKLYDSSFNLIAGTFDNQTGVFTKTDSSRWELAEDETCYIVLTTENDTAQVFGWLKA